MIKLFLSTNKWDPLSAVIRWNTRCPWSHAGFMREEDGWTFSAMTDGGVKWRKPNPKDTGIVLEALETDKAFAWALTQAGKPYDWRAIAGLALDRDWRSEGSWFCSELVARGYENTSSPLLNPFAQVFRITPRDLTLSRAVAMGRTFRFAEYC